MEKRDGLVASRNSHEEGVLFRVLLFFFCACHCIADCPQRRRGGVWRRERKERNTEGEWKRGSGSADETFFFTGCAFHATKHP